MPIEPAALQVIGAAAQETGGFLKETFYHRRSRREAAKDLEQGKQYEQGIYDRNRNDAIKDRDYENWYNTPMEQMKRLEAAGLNPALIYGSPAAAFEASASTEHQQGPDPGQMRKPYEGGSDITMPNFAQTVLMSEQLRMQRQNQEAQQQLMAAQTLKTLSETTGIDMDNLLMSQTLNDLVKAVSLANDETQVGIDLKRKDIDLKDTQMELNRIKATLTEQQILESKAKVQKMFVDMSFTMDENRRQELQAALDRAQTEQETLILMQNLLQEMSETKLKEAEVTNIPKEREKLLAEVAIIDYQKTHLVSSDVKDWISLLPFFGKGKK